MCVRHCVDAMHTILCVCGETVEQCLNPLWIHLTEILQSHSARERLILASKEGKSNLLSFGVPSRLARTHARKHTLALSCLPKQ